MIETLKKVKGKVVGMALSVGLFATGVSVFADPVPGDDTYPAFQAGNTIDTIVAEFLEIFWVNIPTILTVLGGLIALSFLVNKIRQYISGR